MRIASTVEVVAVHANLAQVALGPLLADGGHWPLAIAPGLPAPLVASPSPRPVPERPDSQQDDHARPCQETAAIDHVGVVVGGTAPAVSSAGSRG